MNELHPAFKRAMELPSPWNEHFPKSQEEARRFEPLRSIRALHRNVLCVATTRVECAWSAYCGPVPGRSHEREYHSVLAEGDKLSESVARAVFPEFEPIMYAT